jgi:hypothetical protein
MEVQSHRFMLGEFACTIICDGGHTANAGFLFSNAPQDELSRVLYAHQLAPDQLLSFWNCLLIETGEKKILVDTGIGSGDGPIAGRLNRGLQIHGVPEERIDLVVLSHGHPDHIGGCTDIDGRLLFPNARFVMTEAEWVFWTSDNELAKLGDTFVRFARKNLPPLNGMVHFIDDGDEILPGIRMVGWLLLRGTHLVTSAWKYPLIARSFIILPTQRFILFTSSILAG